MFTLWTIDKRAYNKRIPYYWLTKGGDAIMDEAFNVIGVMTSRRFVLPWMKDLVGDDKFYRIYEMKKS
jgi:hypothetical protein